MKKTCRYHLQLLSGVLFVFIVLQALAVLPGQQSLSLCGMRLPKMCFLGMVLEQGCPFCGITRSLHLCVHGDVHTAARINLMGVLLFILMGLQIPLRLFLLLPSHQTVDTRKWDSILCGLFLYAAIGRWIWLFL